MRTTGMATISSFLEPDSVAVARTANARRAAGALWNDRGGEEGGKGERAAERRDDWMSFSGPFGDSENIPPRGEMVRARGRAWRCDAGSDRPREAHATRVRPHTSIAISKPRIRGSIDPRRATPPKFKTRLFAAEATSAEAAGRGVGKSGRSPEESSPVTAKGSRVRRRRLSGSRVQLSPRATRTSIEARIPDRECAARDWGRRVKKARASFLPVGSPKGVGGVWSRRRLTGARAP